MTKTDENWFPAKKYGWGWGLPRKWQGWIVLAGYLVALFWGLHLLRLQSLSIPFWLYLIAITGGLVFVCYLKGEKPKWG